MSLNLVLDKSSKASSVARTEDLNFVILCWASSVTDTNSNRPVGRIPCRSPSTLSSVVWHGRERRLFGGVDETRSRSGTSEIAAKETEATKYIL